MGVLHKSKKSIHLMQVKEINSHASQRYQVAQFPKLRHVTNRRYESQGRVRNSKLNLKKVVRNFKLSKIEFENCPKLNLKIAQN